MVYRVLLAAGLMVGLAFAQAQAQQGSGASLLPSTTAPAETPVARSPTLGDTGTSHAVRRVARRRSARSTVVPSSQNGNQPDRASAAGGAR